MGNKSAFGLFRRSPTSGSVAINALLGGTAVALVVGGIIHVFGSKTLANDLWAAAGAGMALYTLVTSVRSILKKRLGVDLIAFLALFGALWVGELFAAGVIAVMVATGVAIESWAQGRARKELRSLVDRTPKLAKRKVPGGVEEVPLGDVVPGDVVLVGPGEVVPVDGVAQSGGVFDESALTGESLPVERDAGETVLSGVVNAGNTVAITVNVPPSESTYSSIVRLAASAEALSAPMVRLADRYALWFLVMTIAVAGTAWGIGGLGRAVAVLVVATPCPLIIAPPVAFIAGLSRAARRGVVVKGGGALERLSRCETLLLDKTGTLTEGRPTLLAVFPSEGHKPDEILRYAGSLDQMSLHVLAHAVVGAAKQAGCDLVLPTAAEEIPGKGIKGFVDGRRVAVGKAEWVGLTHPARWARDARRRAGIEGALTVFVSLDDIPCGAIVFSDRIRVDAARTLRSLRNNGIKRIVMLSGDKKEVAEAVGSVLGVDEVLSERSPADKLDTVKAERAVAPTIMIGDGINDAPALALADVGVAMGAKGLSASSEAADIVLNTDNLGRIGETRVLASRVKRIATQSMLGGIALSMIGMGLASVGMLPAVGGALAQEAIDVISIVNALRALRRPGVPRLEAEDSRLTQRFSSEHEAIISDVEKMRLVADTIVPRDSGESLALLQTIRELLSDEIEPHEREEEKLLYPAFKKYLGIHDPTAVMERAHAEIIHQIRRLKSIIDESGSEGPGDGLDDEDVAEIKRSIYGLAAILELHTAQEDESYLSLGETPIASTPA